MGISSDKCISHTAARLLRLVALCITATFLLHARVASATEPERPLVLGFLPAFNAERIVGTFEPLLDYINERVGVRLRLETAPDMSEYMRRITKEQRYAFSFMAPHLYPSAERAGYRAIAKVAGPDLRAVFVVRKESPVTQTADLKGKQLAVTGDTALITVLGKAMLREAGMTPGQDVTLTETANMDSSVQTVLRGRTDAAVVSEPFYRERLTSQVRDQLRVVATSASVPHMPVAVAPWVDPALRDKVVSVLLGMNNDATTAELLHRLGWSGFTPASSADYAPLEKLMDGTKR